MQSKLSFKINRFRDRILKAEMLFSLAFMKPSRKNLFGPPSLFGIVETGGLFAFVDPKAEKGYGYVLNEMITSLIDPRELAQCKAVYRTIGETEPYHQNITKILFH